jgi:hypothetical protein
MIALSINLHKFCALGQIDVLVNRSEHQLEMSFNAQRCSRRFRPNWGFGGGWVVRKSVCLWLIFRGMSFCGIFLGASGKPTTTWTYVLCGFRSLPGHRSHSHSRDIAWTPIEGINIWSRGWPWPRSLSRLGFEIQPSQRVRAVIMAYIAINWDSWGSIHSTQESCVQGADLRIPVPTRKSS